MRGRCARPRIASSPSELVWGCLMGKVVRASRPPTRDRIAEFALETSSRGSTKAATLIRVSSVARANPREVRQVGEQPARRRQCNPIVRPIRSIKWHRLGRSLPP
jgi:hypothetical protein